MKILIEATQAIRRHRGWGRYNLDLLRALIQLGGNTFHIFYQCFKGQDIGLRTMLSAKNTKFFPIYCSMAEYRTLEEDTSRSFIETQFPDVDIYHAVTEFPFFSARIPTIVTIHELTPLLLPEHRSQRFVALFRKQLSNNLNQANVSIVTVSENTKKDLLSLFPGYSKKIHVIPNGVNEIFMRKNSVDLPANIKPYVLYVGSIRDLDKHFSFLIQAYKEGRFNENLVIVNNEYSKSQLSSKFNLDLTQSNKLFLYSDISDYLLSTLYQNAKLFVFPSLHEGFGLPLIEAMASRCPVLCARNSSMAEIAERECIFFVTANYADFYQKLQSCLSHYPEQLISKAFDKVERKYNWGKSARRYLNLYSEVVNRNLTS